MEDATKDLDFDGSPDRVLVNPENILKKAIQNAIDGGWETQFNATIKSVDYRQGKLERNMIITVHAKDGDISIMHNLESIIYSHDFAKALWGECTDWVEPIRGEYRVPQNGYEHHLQQMVIADDPICYLGENLDG